MLSNFNCAVPRGNIRREGNRSGGIRQLDVGVKKDVARVAVEDDGLAIRILIGHALFAGVKVFFEHAEHRPRISRDDEIIFTIGNFDRFGAFAVQIRLNPCVQRVRFVESRIGDGIQLTVCKRNRRRRRLFRSRRERLRLIRRVRFGFVG